MADSNTVRLGHTPPGRQDFRLMRVRLGPEILFMDTGGRKLLNSNLTVKGVRWRRLSVPGERSAHRVRAGEHTGPERAAPTRRRDPGQGIHGQGVGQGHRAAEARRSDQVRPCGDTVVVHTMDRLASNLDDLRSVVQTLTGKGARVEFVKESLVFTGEDSPMANLMPRSWARSPSSSAPSSRNASAKTSPWPSSAGSIRGASERWARKDGCRTALARCRRHPKSQLACATTA